MTNAYRAVPELGFGLGLRPKHYPFIFEHNPEIDWFEIISENFMDTDGRPKRNLARIRERYPVVMHGVSLSIGTVDPLNSEYLQKLKALMDWVQPAWVSDHLCWTGVAHRNVHDLLPVPYTEEALKHIITRIKQVQDYLERPIALENPSTYLEFKSSSIPEAEFITRMAQESGCHLLLDVNNVYVSCFNHRLDPKAYIDTMPLDHVVQIHLAGHDNQGTHIIDTHDNHVVDEVWALYQYTLHKAGRVPNTMIEWDDHIPDFPVLMAELDKARSFARTAQEYGDLPNLAQPRPLPSNENGVSVAQEQARLQAAIVAGVDHSAQDWIHDKENFPADAQLGVYVTAYRYRLYGVVAEDYPLLAYYLGEAAFKKLIWDFIESTPSEHFNIARYAAQLPAFVVRERPDDVLAQEIAQLETVLTQLADAAETPALTQNDLAGLTPDRLMTATFIPRSAFQMMSFTYPVNAYYRAFMEDRNPSPPSPQASYIAVFRHDDKMWRTEFDQNEYDVLQAILNGATIGDALSDMNEDVAGQVSEWFSRWMHQHLLSTITHTDMKEETHVAA